MLFCIVLSAVSYFNYMMMQKRLSERASKQGTMSRVATAIATLAAHKLQFGPLLAENSGGPFPEKESDSPSLFPLFRELAKPLADMRDVSHELDLHEVPTSDLYSITRDLEEPIEKTGDFSARIFYTLDPKKFHAIGLAANGYHREKAGTIKLLVQISFSRQGATSLTEEFSFDCGVRVVAPFVPVVSKFSLYVENAGDGGSGDFVGFNVVANNEEGEVLPTSPARPLVLDNDGPGHFEMPLTFRELVEGPRGLVFLGGPQALSLNLAYSSHVPGSRSLGETFQLFRKSDGEGFYPFAVRQTPTGDPVTLFQMEVGMATSSHPNVALFYDLLQREAPSFWPKLRDGFNLEHSSLFRLFGTDGNRSPTLVLGKVHRTILLARIYQCPRLTQPPWNNPPGRIRERLYLYDTLDQFRIETRLPNGKLVLPVEAGFIPDPDWDIATYTLTCSSFIASSAYNLGLAYCSNARVPDPWTRFPHTDPLYGYFFETADTPARTTIPEAFRPAAPGVPHLRELGPFLPPLADAARLVYDLEIPKGEDSTLWEALRRRGLLWDNTLLLPGLIRVKTPAKKLILDRNLVVLGNGGLLLSEGDIILRGSLRTISASRNRVTVQIAALNGNIRFENGPGAVFQANLTANGTIEFAGDPKMEIIGSLAMKRLFSSSDALKKFPGGQLSYYPALAALPAPSTGAAPGEDVSEKPLLGFAFEPAPMPAAE
jgi:hypothetical protein